MLAIKAPFPFVGATAYVKGSAQEVTILQRNADGTCSVKLHPPRHMTREQQVAWHNRGASLTRTEDAGDLYETAEEASLAGLPHPRPCRPSKPRRRGKRRA